MDAVIVGFTEKSGRWLIADTASVGGVEDSLTLAASVFDLGFEKDGDNLYLTASNQGMFDRFARNANVNPLYSSGMLEALWNDFSAKHLGDKSALPLQDAFRHLANHPEQYLVEQSASGALWALNFGDILTGTVLDANAASLVAYDSAAVAAGSGLASIRRDPGFRRRFFGGYLGAKTDISKSRGYGDYDANMNGVYVGAAFDVSSAFGFGAYYSHAKAKAGSGLLASSLEAYINSVGAFAAFTPCGTPWRVDADAVFSHFDNRYRRYNPVNGPSSADYDQWSWGVGLRAAYAFDFGSGGVLSPFAAARYQHVHQDGFSERGGGFFNNRLGRVNGDSFFTRLGVRYEREFCLGPVRLTPAAYAAWRHEWADRQVDGTGGFVNAAQTFTIRSTKLRRDYADLGVKLAAEVLRRERFAVTVEAGYEARLAKDYVNHSWQAGVGISF